MKQRPEPQAQNRRDRGELTARENQRRGHRLSASPAGNHPASQRRRRPEQAVEVLQPAEADQRNQQSAEQERQRGIAPPAR